MSTPQTRQNKMDIATNLTNSTAQLALKAPQTSLDTTNTNVALKSPIDSPAFTSIPTAPTASVNTNTQQLATTAYVMNQEPAGQVSHFAMITPPNGWLKANGALINRITYARLFTAIGTLFGVGDGTTTFGLPDLRGEFIRGYDDGAGIDTSRVFGSYQADDNKSHNHVTSSVGGYKAYGGSTGVLGTGTGFSTDLNTLTTGNTGAVETRVKNIAMLVCIKY